MRTGSPTGELLHQLARQANIMYIVRTILLIIVAVLAAPPARGQTEQTVTELVRTIRADLPKGWKATYDKTNSWLEVSREGTVLAISALPNGPPDEEPAQMQFSFAFRVGGVVSPLEHQRLTSENRKIQQEANAIYDELVSKHVSQKFDSFSPNTEEDKRTVAQYEALKKSMHPLPDFSFRDISLQWEVNSPENPIIDIIDPPIQKECTQVREKVLKLLTKY